MGTRLPVFVVLCGAFASTGWAAPHPQIPIWNARGIEGACSRTLTNARAQVAALEKLPLSQATAGRVFLMDDEKLGDFVVRDYVSRRSP